MILLTYNHINCFRPTLPGKANSLKSRKSIRRNKTSSAGEEMLDEEAEDEDEEGPNTDMAWSGATGTHANTQGMC